MRVELVGKTYDVVWMDPYDSMPDHRVAADARSFRARNTIGTYLFWWLERVVLDALQLGEVVPDVTPHERAFFARWRRTRPDALGGRLPDLWTPGTFPAKQREIFDAIGRPWTPGPPVDPARVRMSELQLLLIGRQIHHMREDLHDQIIRVSRFWPSLRI